MWKYYCNSQIKFLCDDSDAYMLVKGTLTITKGQVGEQTKEIKTKWRRTGEANKGVIFKIMHHLQTA